MSKNASPLLTHDVVTIAAENLYTLSIDRQATKTLILMQLHIPQVNTRDFPLTAQFLKLYLPSIFAATCYNDEDLPFTEEVTKTELGHLFEHMLLENLCIIKLENGLDNAVFEGVTDWNWIQEPRGTFHITINAGGDEMDILQEAISRTITLMNVILTKEDTVSIDLPIPSQTTRH